MTLRCGGKSTNEPSGRSNLYRKVSKSGNEITLGDMLASEWTNFRNVLFPSRLPSTMPPRANMKVALVIAALFCVWHPTVCQDPEQSKTNCCLTALVTL
jgi:hypothetical protein